MCAWCVCVCVCVWERERERETALICELSFMSLIVGRFWAPLREGRDMQMNKILVYVMCEYNILLLG